MGCNCKTTEKILKIHKKYGYEVQTSWKERVNYKITNILMKILKDSFLRKNYLTIMI